MSDPRLSKSDWLKQGLRTLASEGAGGLKAGPMAAALKVSRGSFYWHFADIADFRAQLLAAWQETATDQVIRDVAEQAEPDRLKHLMQRAFTTRHNLDQAIRAWAAEDPAVAALVAAADATRIAYIARLLVEAGVEAQTAGRRATFLYWAYLGQAVVMDRRHGSMAAAMAEDISEMFER